MDRRDFLRRTGVSLALGAIPGCARAAARAASGASSAAVASGVRRVDRIGLQLYTLRDAARANLTQTLTDVAAIGYREIELLDSMQNFGMPPAALRALLDRLGLRAPSTHIATTALDDVGRLAGDAHVLGHDYVIVASLPLDAKSVTLDDYRRWADRLNEAGERVRRENLWLGFHDEPENFRSIDGKVPYDVLVERLDPARVRLQLDTGNAALGGIDPVPYMERWGERYWLFHLKDAPSLGAPHDAELGTGVVKLREIIARAGSLEGKHLYVEQETYPGAPIESVRRDYAYLRDLRY